MFAKNEDKIIYKKGNAVANTAKEVETSDSLSDFYSGKYKDNKLEKMIVNPKEVLDNIKSKLTNIELHVLKNLVRWK